MPYYSWRGVNLRAVRCKGKLFARDKTELDTLLFKKDIALLHAFPQKLRTKKINEQEVLHYIIQLQTLVGAGVMVPEALNTIASYSSSAYFSSICYEVADRVGQGIPLAVALAKYPNVFNSIVIQVVSIGQESGSLPQSLGVLAHYLESVLQFRKKLRAAFLLPTITFAFFLLMIGIILVVIVPQFVSLCATMQKKLPESTQTLLEISNFLRSAQALFALGILGMVTMLCAWYKKTAHGKEKISRIIIAVPILSSLITHQIMAVFFRSTAQLLQGGMPLAKALIISAESVENSHIRGRMRYVAAAVEAGMPLNESLHECVEYLDQSTMALISVGQETGRLADMLLRVADQYQEHLLAQMNRITTLIQPLLLIILGLMIGTLILGLYAPIMNLSAAL